MSKVRRPAISKAIPKGKRQGSTVRQVDRREPRQSEAIVLQFRVLAFVHGSSRFHLGQKYVIRGRDSGLDIGLVQLVAEVKPPQLPRNARAGRGDGGIVEADGN